VPDDRPESSIRAIGAGHEVLIGQPVFKAAGCPACLQTGYRGRIAIHEALKVNRAIEDLILSRSPASAVRQAARESGMRTLRESALGLVRQGITSIDEAMENTISEEASA